MRPIEPLVLDLVEWIAVKPRRESDVLDAWRTSCPRLTVWEEAVERGFVERSNASGGRGIVVEVTAAGRAALAAAGRWRPAAEIAPAVAVAGAQPRPRSAA